MIIWVIFFALFIPGVVALIQIFMAEVDLDETSGKLKVIIPNAILLISTVIIGLTIANSSLKQNIEGFKAYKQTIESSISNENLTGLERIELVKVATEQNAMLAKFQYVIHIWYNVGYKAEYKEELLRLTPIRMEGK